MNSAAMRAPGPEQQYDLLKRLFRRLVRRFRAEDFDRFVQVASTLPGSLLRAVGVSSKQKQALRSFLNPESADWQRCQRLAGRQRLFSVQARTHEAVIAPAEATALAIRLFRRFHYVFEVVNEATDKQAAEDLHDLIDR